jgi:hypothetical protein
MSRVTVPLTEINMTGLRGNGKQGTRLGFPGMGFPSMGCIGIVNCSNFKFQSGTGRRRLTSAATTGLASGFGVSAPTDVGGYAGLIVDFY